VFVVYIIQHKAYGLYSIAYGVRLKGLGLSTINHPKVTENVVQFPDSYKIVLPGRPLFFRNPEQTIINRKYVPDYMAAARKQTDSFFIRGRVNGGSTNVQGITTIDLGAYVDALGQSVLRIHKISVEVADLLGGTLTVTANEAASIRMALTTAYPSASLTSPILSDNSTIAVGHMICFNDQGSTAIPSSVQDDFAEMDQAFTNGYLVAVDNIYLSAIASSAFAEAAYVGICLECTVEKLDERAAVSLALSQSQNQ